MPFLVLAFIFLRFFDLIFYGVAALLGTGWPR